MICSEFETRLCDFLDGTLERTARQEMEQHASECHLCAALYADSTAFSTFLEKAPAVDAPPELITTILYQTQSARTAQKLSAGGLRRWLGFLFQPRFVMGMAMTILSFSMLSRVAGVKIRQVSAADLNPVSVWRGIDNQSHRLWDRGVKFYQNVRFIYEIMAQLRALNTDEEPAREADQKASEKADSPQSKQQTQGRRIEPSPDRER